MRSRKEGQPDVICSLPRRYFTEIGETVFLNVEYIIYICILHYFLFRFDQACSVHTAFIRRSECLISTFPVTYLLIPTSHILSYCLRLKDCCERLMFHDPIEYGRKAEELLWRKVFYDAIQTMKQFKKVSLVDFLIKPILGISICFYVK